MRKVTLFVLFPVLALLVATGPAGAEQPDIRRFPDCQYCGMHRKNFAHCRMVVKRKDGTAVGVCSINCAAIDYIRDLDRLPESLMVGDYISKKLIFAEKAHWVLGGNIPGVMTERAKWAFAKKSDARLFVKKHGGTLVTFDEAMRASYEDMYEDMRALEKMKKEHARHVRSAAAAPTPQGMN
jgi:copper chaperone NosL